MIYFKSVLAGVVTAFAATVIWILAVFVLPLLFPFLLSRVIDDGTGGGSAGATVGSGSILAVALVGFAVGFGWMFRRVNAARRQGQPSTPDGPPPAPPDWGSGLLTSYLDLTRRQQFATFVNFRPYYDKICEVDAAFVRVHENLVDPEDLTAPFFTLLAHAAYRAAAGLAMSTQSAPAFAVMRQCLENSLYGLYINQHPDSLETWIKRDVDQAAKKKMRDEFTIANLKKTLETVDPDTSKVWSKMYEKTIDCGAHPNPSALVSALTMDEGEKSIRFKVSYLTKEPEVIRGTMKSVAQTGVCSLLILRNVLPQRFDQLGITKSLQQLQQGL